MGSIMHYLRLATSRIETEITYHEKSFALAQSINRKLGEFPDINELR